MTAPMTAPMTGPPTGPTAGPPAPPLERLEIRTDRAAVFRRVKRALQWEFLGAMLLAGVFGAFLVVLVGESGPGVPLLLMTGFALGVGAVTLTLFWMLTGPVTWLMRREMPVPLTADADGVWMAVPGTAEGFVRLPWSAVRSVTTRGRRAGKAVVVAMRRDVPPTAPGVGGLTDAVTVGAARRGIVVSTYGTDVTARDARAALDRFALAAAAGVPR